MPGLLEVAKQTNAWACYDCGKCSASCPITRAGGAYSPRRHVLATNLRQESELLEGGELFTCLTCGQCDDRCPSEVQYGELVRQLREIAHGSGVEPECPHGGGLQSVMRMMASGGTRQNRLEWLDDDLRTQPETGEYFFWTGCTMYYDAFFGELALDALAGTRATVKVLNQLGIEPVVSAEERCCGHDLLWNGDRESFEALARHNVGLVEKSGAKTLVCSCAECLRTWRTDYQPFFEGPPPLIMHISEIVAVHLKEIDFEPNGERRVTFQDPCRMGRHLGVYDPPREVLEALPGVELSEMRRSGSKALCCSGGTWSGCDRISKTIQVDRLREARATGAEVLVTACPKCQIHLRCAAKDPNLEDELTIEMKDLAELVAEAMYRNGGGGERVQNTETNDD